jgi:hypothetical protein
MASKIKVDQIEGSSGSSITIPSGQTLTIADGLSASTIGSGTLSDARLPTVPVAKGGTGLTSLGTAGQALKVNSGANGLEFGDASSDFVKLASSTFSNVAQIDLDGTSVWGTAGTYTFHRLVFSNLRLTASGDFYVRQLENGTVNSNSSYSWNVIGSNSSTALFQGRNGDSDSSIILTRDQVRGDGHGTNYINFEMTIGNLNPGANANTMSVISHVASPNHDGARRMCGHLGLGITTANDAMNANRTGIRFYTNNGNMYGTYTVYGFKA